ncbi:hypothetical protein BDV29DRAFT_200721 [Aspergillus leporis]|uniref:Xylanolytic transcriptional activator regulatory domain-containing protein n=1 Tax=Aspergillus leporis TaxID=41062 RepID=A0A5N5X4P0_9EURO|nr:hypothetical protein BDV29DRAFT_200721 [Aspergillus leporis]
MPPPQIQRVETTDAPTTPGPQGDAREDAEHRTINYGEAVSTMGIAQKIVGLGPGLIDEQATSAIPGYQASTSVANWRTAAVGQRFPIASILGQSLPSSDVMCLLLEDYFDAVQFFSLAIYEPTFRRNLHSIADSQASADGHDWRLMSADLFKMVESHIVELMDQPSVTAAQICILFGSYCVYHGRSQPAAGLHREPSRGTFEDHEERKRVWWTIYTWDRFASITYGGPLGINDRDCNISMPADISENRYFISSRSEQNHTTCYSTYQRELNRLYLMASTALEAIVGSRTSGSSKELAGDAYLALVKKATQNLEKCGPSARAHALQSLSLRLTYGNILIVLHRPILSRQVDHLSTGPSSGRRNQLVPNAHDSDATSPGQMDSPFEALSPNASVAGSVHWWNAALSTPKVTDHLVAFLAINVFNAAIVLAAMALSDPLSDTAQVVKRTITRILRLQDLLGKRSALSKQRSLPLQNKEKQQ